MAHTIETTPTGATAVTLKSAQISEFLQGLQENEERRTSCLHDKR